MSNSNTTAEEALCKAIEGMTFAEKPKIPRELEQPNKIANPASKADALVKALSPQSVPLNLAYMRRMAQAFQDLDNGVEALKGILIGDLAWLIGYLEDFVQTYAVYYMTRYTEGLGKFGGVLAAERKKAELGTGPPLTEDRIAKELAHMLALIFAKLDTDKSNLITRFKNLAKAISVEGKGKEEQKGKVSGKFPQKSSGLAPNDWDELQLQHKWLVTLQRDPETTEVQFGRNCLAASTAKYVNKLIVLRDDFLKIPSPKKKSLDQQRASAACTDLFKQWGMLFSNSVYWCPPACQPTDLENGLTWNAKATDQAMVRQVVRSMKLPVDVRVALTVALWDAEQKIRVNVDAYRKIRLKQSQAPLDPV